MDRVRRAAIYRMVGTRLTVDSRSRRGLWSQIQIIYRTARLPVLCRSKQEDAPGDQEYGSQRSTAVLDEGRRGGGHESGRDGGSFRIMDSMWPARKGRCDPAIVIIVL